MKYVIIGGDAAGMSAAMEILRNDSQAEIITLERGEIYSYAQCGLPYVVDGRIPSTEKLIARTVENFRERGIDARTSHDVQEIDFEQKMVHGMHKEESFSISYDRLLIATGADSIIPDWGNKQLGNIYTIKTIPQMERLLKALSQAKHVTVLGGGYIALEMAETLRERGLAVRLIHRGQQLMGLLHEDLAQQVYKEAVYNGIDVQLNEQVIGFEGDNSVKAVITENGRFETDLVVVATGISPNTQFATTLAQMKNGAIIVDETMQTSIANVYAAGDCAAHFHRLKNDYDYIALGTTANKQGRIAGLNMAGKRATFKGVLGTAILKFFNLDIGMTGLNEKDATKQGIAIDVYTHDAKHIASYYPSPLSIRLHVIVEKHTEKLLGLQAAGAGVDKRIDVFATALTANMTLGDLLDIDLSYAPPYNGALDPLAQLAKRNS